MNDTKKNNTKFYSILIVLIIIIIATLSVTVWAILTKEKTVITPDYAPVELDPNATPINGNEDKLPHSEGGSSVGIIYAKDLTVNLRNREIELLFANPQRSNQDMVIAIVIQDCLLVTSGRITPGNKITRLKLNSDAIERLTMGGYNGKIIISCYNPVSGEKSLLNTEISVLIQVVE